MLAWYDRVLDAFGRLAGMAALLIGVGVSLDVALRELGFGSLPWMLEAAEYGLFVITFLGAPWALREGAHVRIDIAARLLPSRGQHLASRAGDALGLAITLLLTVYAARITYASWSRGAMVYKELVFPEWWLLALVPLAMALMVIEFLRRLGRS